jgi:tetratricopeptide (TPR) repeat protein
MGKAVSQVEPGEEVMMATKLIFLICLMALLSVCAGCNESGRSMNHKAIMQMQDKDYAGALASYEKGLELEPDSKVLVLGKARALFELGRYQEALPLFEYFIQQAYSERATFKDEIFDAEFFRDKCKQELGLPVEQNKEAIPPPRMGE